MVGRSDYTGWPDVALAAIRMVPDLIKAIDQMMSDRSSDEKLAGAVELLQAQEPMVVETDALKAAREAAISAQVAYANALAAATSTHGA